MKVFVICNNDSIEYVFIGHEEDAQVKCDEMKAEYKGSNKQYAESCFWHLHEVESNLLAEWEE